MKNNFIIFCSLIVTIFSVLSCTDDNKTVNTTEFTLNTTLPEGFEEPSISNMVVKFTNVNTGRVTNNTTFENNQIHVTLPEGMYHIIMEGFIQYKREGESHEGLIRGYEEFVPDRKSTRLNSSHANISYAVFCLKKISGS